MSHNRSLQSLESDIASKRAIVGIFGAGYVGLPLACAFAESGFRTMAVDRDERKIESIREGKAYVEDSYVREKLAQLVKAKLIEPYVDPDKVAPKIDIGLITVPTPLTTRGEPDLSNVTSVASILAKNLRTGQLIVLESSVYPGTTEEIVLPILNRSGLRVGVDFGLAHSPERIDYNNRNYTVLNIPKLVGGITPTCTRVACQVYKTIIRAPVIPVSNARTAEAAKMLENTYRYVNIAMVNELALLHEKLGIDFHEVISAASSKPFGFQPFYPGPGVGGHCIPKDPHYLAYKARQVGMNLAIVDVSAEINQGMAKHIIERLDRNLRTRGKSLKDCGALILGLAFKADVSDARRSPALALAKHLKEFGSTISCYDPYVDSVDDADVHLRSSSDLESAARGANVILLVTPHTIFRSIDLRSLARQMSSEPTIFDTRGFWARAECEASGFKYLCVGRPD